MSVQRSLSASRRDELLRRACDRSVPAELVGTEAGAVQRRTTRFLRALLDAEGVHLVVQTPLHEGRLVPYRPGALVDVLFAVAGERYGFSSTVEGRCYHRLNDEVEVPALIVSYPDVVENRQRRAHYRVPLSATDPCTVTFCELVRTRPDAPGVGDGDLYSALVRDISTGGMAMLSLQHLPVGFGMGTLLRVSFQLPGGENHINLEAAMRNERRPVQGEGRIIGIEFLNVEKTLGGRKAADEIGRFVVARQREILKKLKAP